MYVIDSLFKAVSHRHAGSVAIGVFAAMGLWLWQPDAPSWFHLGGAFAVATVCAGGLAEAYVHFLSTVDESREEIEARNQ